MTHPTTLLTLRPEQVAQHPDNVRDPGRDIDALAASISEVGVLVPLIVIPVASVEGTFNEQVTHIAVDGNRRQLAAAQIGADLPCLVRPDLAAAREATVTMAVTGLVRDGLTLAEEVHAVQAMLDLGLSQAAVSRRTGRKPAQVRAAKKAAGLDPATVDAAAQYDLTLDELASLAEWQGDQEATATLLAAAERGTMDHAVARLRRDQAETVAKAALIEQLTAAGTALTEERPGMYDVPTRLDALNPEADSDDVFNPETHAGCPGHAGYVTADYQGRAVVVYCCTDPVGNGHHRLYQQHGGAGQRSGPMNEQEKAERKQLIARNKQMAAAQDVRIAFVAATLSSKKHAKTLTAWAIERIIHRDRTLARWLGEYGAPKMIGKMLNTEHPDRALAQASPARQPVLIWAEVCAAYESEFTKDAWRRADRSRAAYLAHLVELGYRPCETEQLMIDQAAADHSDDTDIEPDEEPDDEPDGMDEDDI